MFAALKTVLVPPISLLFVVLAGLLLARRFRRTGWALCTLGALGLLALSLPYTANMLIAALERDLPRTSAPTAPPQAVVILSAELRAVDPRRGAFEPGPLTMERLFTGMRVARQARLPILVTGGAMQPDAPALAEVMARSLVENFNIAVRWRETESRDTWQNAQFSATILREAGISRIYLVSHAWHLRRGIAAFERFGISAVAVPVRLQGWPPLRWEEFVPSTASWNNSAHALHEWIGLLYYALR